jgi:hypothetical protein
MTILETPSAILEERKAAFECQHRLLWSVGGPFLPCQPRRFWRAVRRFLDSQPRLFWRTGCQFFSDILHFFEDTKAFS